MTWQPIETAPKDGTLILLHWTYQWEDYEDRSEIGCVVGKWIENAFDSDPSPWVVHTTNPYFDYVRPTHWMPLPPDPEA